ncbi:hypothetical protein NT6N_20480 [Oceaniferula spumae]|uniref:Ice-binding protein C-terminal domain-containing protein n=1 Tax=Oceaniferula spumae TaxID=2979115 RepID=A0AAT9FM31_9BACT
MKQILPPQSIKHLATTTLSFVALASTSHAALSLLNGDFESQVAYQDGSGANLYSDRIVGTTPAGTDWYESNTTATFNGDAILNSSNTAFNGQYRSGAIGTSQTGWGNVALLANTSNYIYQNLGAYTNEATMTVSVTGFERVSGGTTGDFNLQVTVYAQTGAFTPGTGTDIASAGLTQLGQLSYHYDFDNSVTTYDSEDHDFVFNGFSGATSGDNIWIDIRKVTGAGTHVATIDNVSISTTAIPEPSATALISLAGLGFFLRRRR